MRDRLAFATDFITDYDTTVFDDLLLRLQQFNRQLHGAENKPYDPDDDENLWWRQVPISNL